MEQTVKTLTTGVTEHYNGPNYHNDNGPAIVHPDGSYAYYLNGKRHRTDGPALYLAAGDGKSGRREAEIYYFINGIRVAESAIK